MEEARPPASPPGPRLALLPLRARCPGRRRAAEGKRGSGRGQSRQRSPRPRRERLNGHLQRGAWVPEAPGSPSHCRGTWEVRAVAVLTFCPSPGPGEGPGGRVPCDHAASGCSEPRARRCKDGQRCKTWPLCLELSCVHKTCYVNAYWVCLLQLLLVFISSAVNTGGSVGREMVPRGQALPGPRRPWCEPS